MTQNFEAFLKRKFGKVKKTGGKQGTTEYLVTCPKCGKQKLSINPERGVYKCWRGCMDGSVSDLLGDVAQMKQRPEHSQIVALPAGIDPPGELVALTELPEDHPAITYLTHTRTRTFDPKELNDVFGIRYCISGQTFGHGLFNTTNTLVFPIWMDNKLVGWQSRLLYNPDSLTDEQCAALHFIRDEDGDWVKPPKYFTSPGLTKERIFFNCDWARQSQVIVLTEGPFDAISVGRCAIATLGKGISEQQIKMVRAYWDVAIVLLDPEGTRKETAKLHSSLYPSTIAIRLDLKKFGDPGDAPRDEIWIQIGKVAYEMGIDLLKYRILI